MIASVSSAGRESRLFVLLRCSLMSPGAPSGRVTSRNPPPTSISWSARPSSSRRRARVSMSSRVAAGDSRSRTSWMRTVSIGVSEANSNASSTLTGSVMLGLRILHGLVGCRRVGGSADNQSTLVDRDFAEGLRLTSPYLPQPHQLEQGEQRHDPLRADLLSACHGREEEGPRVAQQLENLVHAFEHG